MMWLLSLPGAVKRWAIALAGFAVILTLAVLKGKSLSDTKHDRQRIKEERKTNDAITNAPKSDNPADARAWLDAHAKRLRDGRKP
jgi:hypothetical protein